MDLILPLHLESFSLSILVVEMVNQPGGGWLTILPITGGLLCERPHWWGTEGLDFSEFRQVWKMRV